MPGGYDADGALTTDPGVVLANGCPLPIGFWKGSALAILLDVLGAVLAAGKTTVQVGKLPAETNITQVFIAFDVTRCAEVDRIIDEVIDDLHATPLRQTEGGGSARYPGEGSFAARVDSEANGVRVSTSVWTEIQALSAQPSI